MSSLQLQIRLRVSWKLCRKLCSRRRLWLNLNLLIKLNPLRLLQLKIEFEDGLINFKILFLKDLFSYNFLFSNLSYFIHTVDWKKNYKKNMFTTEEGNLFISSCLWFYQKFIKSITLDSGLTLWLTLLIILFKWLLKFSIVSTLIPSNYSSSLISISVSSILIITLSFLFIRRWHLLKVALVWLSENRLNNII